MFIYFSFVYFQPWPMSDRQPVKVRQFSYNSWFSWNLSFRYISFHEKRLQMMLWHHNARVNSHQRWKQTRFRVCFHLWCELILALWWHSIICSLFYEIKCNGMTSFMEFMSDVRTSRSTSHPNDIHLGGCQLMRKSCSCLENVVTSAFLLVINTCKLLFKLQQMGC